MLKFLDRDWDQGFIYQFFNKEKVKVLKNYTAAFVVRSAMVLFIAYIWLYKVHFRVYSESTMIWMFLNGDILYRTYLLAFMYKLAKINNFFFQLHVIINLVIEESLSFTYSHWVAGLALRCTVLSLHGVNGLNQTPWSWPGFSNKLKCCKP